MKKTVVELDLVGYSTISANFEEGLDVDSVRQLNAQIQKFVDAGLAAVQASREQTVMQTTGDGAILVFDSAAEGHAFAVAVHQATAAHNAERPQPLAKRVFRIGAATGDIVMDPKPAGGFEIAGGTIARAVRLEAKASPGGLLIDELTFSELPPAQKKFFEPAGSIAGKRDEVFVAHRSQPNPNGPRDAAFFASAPKSPSSPALEIWIKKLAFLEREEALSFGEQKFALQERIEEAKAYIAKYRSGENP